MPILPHFVRSVAWAEVLMFHLKSWTQEGLLRWRRFGDKEIEGDDLRPERSSRPEPTTRSKMRPGALALVLACFESPLRRQVHNLDSACLQPIEQSTPGRGLSPLPS